MPLPAFVHYLGVDKALASRAHGGLPWRVLQSHLRLERG